MSTMHQKLVNEFMRLAGQRVPSGPMMPDNQARLLRAKLIHEECMETLEALGVRVDLVSDAGEKQEWDYTIRGEPNLVEIVDGCCDIKVVTTGTLSACGIDDEGPQSLVDLNNLAKFGPGGYRRDDGKWVKPPNHLPPNIAGEIETQKAAALAEYRVSPNTCSCASCALDREALKP